MGRLGGQVGALALALDALLERARERGVHLGALARQQVVVDDLAQQRVAEARSCRRQRDRDLAADGLAQRLEQLGGLQAAPAREQLVGRALAGEPAQQLLRAERDSRSTRSISASRSVGGSAPRPSSPAARISSVKSALPSQRA